MNDIFKIAESHIEELNKKSRLHQDFKWSFNPKPKEYFNSWYFDYQILPKKNPPKDLSNQFGGAPGFIILKKTFEVQGLNWSDLHDLQNRADKRKKLNNILTQLRKENWSLLSIKTMMKLNLKDALTVKEKYKELDFSIKDNELKFIDEMETFLEKISL